MGGAARCYRGHVCSHNNTDVGSGVRKSTHQFRFLIGICVERSSDPVFRKNVEEGEALFVDNYSGWHRYRMSPDHLNSYELLELLEQAR